MKIELSPRARRDLLSIRRYISKDNPAAADQTLRRIRRAVDQLALIPELGRPWQDGPTRALSIAGIPYRVHYMIKGDVISVLTIWHTSRRAPTLDAE